MDLSGYEVPLVLITCRKIIKDEVFNRLYDEDAVSLCCLGILQLVLLCVEAKRRIPDWILRLENDKVGWDNYPWDSFVWPTLYSQLKNTNVKWWPKLYASQPANEIDKKAYSIFGYTWAFKRNLPAARLTPDETEARSNWWISSRAYFDGSIGQTEILPHHLNRQNMYEVPSELYRQFEEQKRAIEEQKRVIEEIQKNEDDRKQMYEKVRTFMKGMNVEQNILNRGKREQRPSFYKRTPYTKQPPTTILPKQRGNKNKNNVMKSNLSPLNLRDAFDDENEGGDDVIYLGGEFTGNYLVYENVDPQKGYLVPVPFWQQLVPHLCIPDIDSRTPMGWLSREVFLPIHVGGNHWVTGVIDLPNAHVYVFDSLPNEGRMNLLWNQIQRWTPVVNNILQGQERSAIVNGDPQEFWETISNNMCKCFYLSRCEDTRDYGYD
uniref:Phospholipase-like protein n=1 Tax=Tanacetum cinerariifolium TaxID=118510 RepID=A0A6L2K985_TANCI|nr:phospholipase-like protein [Tanacetum cinerariifolium]